MSKNVYLDLGFTKDEAVELALRAELSILIERLIEARGLTQGKAAKLFGVPQPTISKIVNKRLSNLSLTFLIRMLVHAGLPFSLKAGRDPDNVFVSIDEDEGDALTLYRDVQLVGETPTAGRVTPTSQLSSIDRAEFQAAEGN